MHREADDLAEPDETLASCAANGDDRAFDQLMTRYQAMLYSACLKITGNPDDARDALQDALLRAWWGLPGFRGESKVSTWATGSTRPTIPTMTAASTTTASTTTGFTMTGFTMTRGEVHVRNRSAKINLSHGNFPAGGLIPMALSRGEMRRRP